ncbi:Hypothetical predicted protein, partial [Olea europaea subsp. europaea]
RYWLRSDLSETFNCLLSPRLSSRRVASVPSIASEPERRLMKMNYFLFSSSQSIFASRGTVQRLLTGMNQHGSSRRASPPPPPQPPPPIPPLGPRRQKVMAPLQEHQHWLLHHLRSSGQEWWGSIGMYEVWHHYRAQDPRLRSCRTVQRPPAHSDLEETVRRRLTSGESFLYARRG